MPDSPHAIDSPSFLANFRRITSSGEYIAEIDGLRFIAVMLIMVYHVLVFVCNTQSRTIGRIDALTRGVEMFFVLSGFVLSLPFAAWFLRDGRRVVLTSYFIRRLTRLEPPYLICLAIYTVLKWVQYPEADSIIFRNALLGSVYLHDLVLGRPGMIISVAWSLEVEVQFYLLMPVLALLFLLRPTWLRRTIFAALILIPPLIQPIWLPAMLMHNDGHLLNFIQFFVAGMFLADVWVIEWNNALPPLKRGFLAWGDLIWVLIAPLLVIVPRDIGLLERVPLAAVIFTLYLAMFQSVWIRRLMRVQLITLIGGMCYSIYLMHNLAIGAIGAVWVRMMASRFLPAAVLSCLAMIPWALIVSAIYFRLIERPCMRRDWPKRLWSWFLSRLFVAESQDEASIVGKPPASDR